MTLKRQQWSPDTCGCTLELEYDDDVAPGARTFTTVSVARCADHQALGVVQSSAAVFAENRRKNAVIGRALEVFPDELGHRSVDDHGNTSVTPKARAFGVAFARGASEVRALAVALPLLNVPQRAALQVWCNSTFGVGAVTITD